MSTPEAVEYRRFLKNRFSLPMLDIQVPDTPIQAVADRATPPSMPPSMPPPPKTTPQNWDLGPIRSPNDPVVIRRVAALHAFDEDEDEEEVLLRKCEELMASA